MPQPSARPAIARQPRRRARPHQLVALTLLLAAVTGQAMAEARYVSDELVITFRALPSTRGDILRNLTTGTRVEVLETPADSEWVLVQIRDGRKGWVLKQYLVDQPVARDQVAAARREAEQLRGTVEELREQLQAEQAGRTEAEQSSSGLSSEVEGLKQELAEIRRVSSGALETAAENERVNKLNARLRAELDEMVAERNQFADDAQQRWLLIGGGLVLAGLLLGIMLKARPRRSAWT